MDDVTIIIPQHGRAELTVNCIRSLQQCHSAGSASAGLTSPRIVVVDDASAADQARTLRRAELPGVEVLPLRRRSGVTAAWNAGLRAASAPLVVFLNNDTISWGDWLTGLLQPLRKSSEVPLITGAESRLEPLLPRVVKTSAPAGRLLSGWCLAARTVLLRELGGFDERFQWYFSDTDLQCRLLLREERALRAVHHLPLQHLEHRTARGDPRRAEVWRRDRQRFVEKWLMVEGTNRVLQSSAPD